MRRFFILVLHIFIALCTFSQSVFDIPLKGNSFHSSVTALQDGKNATMQQDTTLVFAYIHEAGELNLSLQLDKVTHLKKIYIQAGKSIFNIVTEQDKLEVHAGNVLVADTGYVTIRIVTEPGVDIKLVRFTSQSPTQKLSYIPNNDGNFFYWGRRGPSVHLNYSIPNTENVEWFYNELTVPVGNDVIGSYFMANGFNTGYFGIQVNSSTERRILFSVWSPFHTDDPKSIPESHKIKMLKKGSDVYTGEFGNEGSGGQSFLRYNWKAGVTYKFLLRAQPSQDSTTTYTAYFFAPEKNEWLLIASFKRPLTYSYLKSIHSFLENFDPGHGHISRRAQYGNGWVYTTSNTWVPITAARFTIDNTGRKGYRLDYKGGVEHNRFYLQNCGFFNANTMYGTSLNITTQSPAPNIKFNTLP